MKQLRRTVKEIFEGESFSFEERMRPFMPSTSANYIRSRKEAGAIGAILDHPELLKGLRKAGGVFKAERKASASEEKIARTDESVTISGTMEDTFKTFWFRILKIAKDEIPRVEPVALAEALKVRVITKGPPFAQTVLRALWKKLHTVMRHHKVFELIGHPVDELYVRNQMGLDLKEDEVYLSADYEAATDNLQPWVSETIADEISICLNLSEIERELMIRILTQHVYETTCCNSRDN